MKRLSKKALKQAETFLQTQARPLEQALFATFLRGAPTEWALTELASFQNSDGGFGHGLEPDLQLADSSVLATTVALQHLRDLGVSSNHLLGASNVAAHSMENRELSSQTCSLKRSASLAASCSAVGMSSLRSAGS